jgi:hypothetical protein
MSSGTLLFNPVRSKPGIFLFQRHRESSPMIFFFTANEYANWIIDGSFQTKNEGKPMNYQPTTKNEALHIKHICTNSRMNFICMPWVKLRLIRNVHYPEF